jgi:hypothetical protein
MASSEQQSEAVRQQSAAAPARAAATRGVAVVGPWTTIDACHAKKMRVRCATVIDVTRATCAHGAEQVQQDNSDSLHVLPPAAFRPVTSQYVSQDTPIHLNQRVAGSCYTFRVSV